jgi:Tfp pilus assembly protein PilN
VIAALTRLALVVAGNRLVVAAIQGRRAQTFVVESEQPAVALRAELDARKLTRRSVSFGLARSAVTVKPLDFPVLGGDLRQMVRFALDRHMPFPADDAAFDFLPLPADASLPGETRRVLVAAADRRAVEGVLRIAEEARLRPISVTVASHDLLGLVRVDRAQRVAWIHRSPLGTDLLFLAGGQLALSRTVAASGDRELAAEIERSYTVLRWSACDALWVSGEGSLAGPDLMALEAPVSAPPYTAWAEQLLAGPQDAPAGLAELALAVAARRGVRPLDLIPDERRPRRITRGQWATASLLAVTVALGMAALLYPGYRANRHLAATHEKIEALTPQVRAVEGVQRDLERKRKLLAAIESLEANALRPLPVLRELTDVVPADAWVTNLSFDSKGVEIGGQATAAAGLIPVLENSSRLERVEFSSPVTRGRDKEQFRIKATWESPSSRSAVPAAPAPASPSARAPARRPPGRGATEPAPPGRGAAEPTAPARSAAEPTGPGRPAEGAAR